MVSEVLHSCYVVPTWGHLEYSLPSWACEALGEGSLGYDLSTQATWPWVGVTSGVLCPPGPAWYWDRGPLGTGLHGTGLGFSQVCSLSGWVVLGWGIVLGYSLPGASRCQTGVSNQIIFNSAFPACKISIPEYTMMRHTFHFCFYLTVYLSI